MDWWQIVLVLSFLNILVNLWEGNMTAMLGWIVVCISAYLLAKPFEGRGGVV